MRETSVRAVKDILPFRMQKAQSCTRSQKRLLGQGLVLQRSHKIISIEYSNVQSSSLPTQCGSMEIHRDVWGRKKQIGASIRPQVWRKAIALFGENLLPFLKCLSFNTRFHGISCYIGRGHRHGADWHVWSWTPAHLQSPLHGIVGNVSNPHYVIWYLVSKGCFRWVSPGISSRSVFLPSP